MANDVNTFEVPQQVIIDGLRNEVARLNDERLSMMLKLDFANQSMRDAVSGV